MSVTPLPPAPNRNDPTNFPILADPFMSALPLFGTEMAAVQADVNAQQVTATTQAVIATTQAGVATTQSGIATTQAGIASAAVASGANSPAWVSGTTYAVGNVVYSPINFRSYRRIVSGGGTTDPSSDTTNWLQISSGSTGSQVFTANGTFNLVNGASYYMIDLVAGGGSGGVSIGQYAGGGGGGERIQRVIPASTLSGSISITVGAGGAAVTSNTVDKAGLDGQNTSFGGLVVAHGGKGWPSGNGGGNGGGITSMNQAFSQAGGVSTSPAEWGGGGGGGTGTGNGSLLVAGSSQYGGGGGGGSNCGYASVQAGSVGGGSGIYTQGGGGAAGTFASPNGLAGIASSSATTSGAGGGGSYGSSTGSVSGGAGGFPGGGGGAATVATGTATSGAGGNGVARIYWW